MIVWLASYPRSGNTLLRTVLHQTLGCGSYSDEVDEEVRRNVAMSDEAAAEYGRRELPQPWEAFYPRATADRETHFVKTHRPPRDAQPAIYVVRDGRSTLVSYERFHERFHGDRARGLLELVLGMDYYGDWSGHYARWTQRAQGRTLVLRYEELVEATPALLERIAAFAGRSSPRAWSNPFDAMNARNPGFFETGRRRWAGDERWTSFIDSLFFELHGELMERLGYASAEDVASARRRLTEGERVLGRLAMSLAARGEELEAVCRDRQAVIEGLHRACEERLALIERLSSPQ
jgi:hypothetical protein